MQNPGGGFGGGHSQVAHIAATYAAVLSLAMVGGAESLELIDRRAMWVWTPVLRLRSLIWVSCRWRWLGELKQQDGGFAVCVGGEKDVRCEPSRYSLLAEKLNYS